MASLEGQRFGRYELEQSLGRGGMAEVYKARDTKLGRMVAVKLVSPTFGEAEFVERFLREARLVASLEHPNILPVYDFGEDQGRPYFVIPLVDGGSLEQRMQRGIIPIARVVDWIRALASALDYAHERGILHRDVKPANVLLGDDRPLLADFGIAKGAEASAKLTATGVVMGTPAYMAPELAIGKQGSKASDLYALAVMTYEMLTGEAPFVGDSALSVLHMHANAPPPRVTLRAGHLPPGIDKVFDRALAKDPGARQTSATLFAQELHTALHLRATDPTVRLSMTGEIPTQKRTVAEVIGRPRRILGAIALAGLLGLLAWVLWARPFASVAPPLPEPVGAAPEPGAAPSAQTAPAPEAATASTPLPATPVGGAPEPASSQPAPSETTAPAGAPEVTAPPAAAATVSGSAATPLVTAADDELGRPPTRAFVRADFERMLERANANASRGASAAFAEYSRGGIAWLDGDKATARATLERLRAAPVGAYGHEPPGLTVMRTISGPIDEWQAALAYGQVAESVRLLETALAAETVTREELAPATKVIRALGESAALLAVLERACANGIEVACAPRTVRRGPRTPPRRNG